ncbi:MAG: hypothetical protein M1539_03870 [Actinobacteria bacterium]|nr:hypothetical protein [Actinomycetota bacterium]MCL5883096.1 hypothetical protein [Actinomycetota bacterium]
MKKFIKTSSSAGTSLVELLVVTVLMSIALTGITKMVIMAMDTQQKIDSDFRAQQDVRQAQYDMEKIIGESKRLDAATNQYPIFQNDLISVPTQQGNWVTYYYATPPGAHGPTLVKIITNTRPAIPPTILSSDKQLINVKPNVNDQYTTVERLNNGPIFTFYKGDGAQPIFNGQSVQTPRDVRSIQVNFRITVSEGHVIKDPVNASVRINMRNY